MYTKNVNTPVSGKDINVYLYREKAGSWVWTTIASFKSATIEMAVDDSEYDFFGSDEPVSYSQRNTVNITLERGHVNARLMYEFKNTMSTSNCANPRPYYLVQIEVCFPGPGVDAGTYMYKIKNGVMKTDSLSLQAGTGENTETITIRASNYDIDKY